MLFYIADVFDRVDTVDINNVSKIVDIIGNIDNACQIIKMLLKIIKGWYGTLKKLKIVNSNYPSETYVSAFSDLFGLLKRLHKPKFDMRHVDHVDKIYSSQ